MKVRAYFKDPDTMCDAVRDAFKTATKPEGISDEEWAEICVHRSEDARRDIADKWMPYSEYLMVEFDTEAGTATVLARSDYGE